MTACIPYIGAGAFAVVLALGSQGPTDAMIPCVTALLANGLLQNILQPFVFGATLGLNPLAVLIETISAGCLFGMLAPLGPSPATAVHTTPG